MLIITDLDGIKINLKIEYFNYSLYFTQKIFVTKLDKVTNYKDNAYLSEKGT